MGFMKSSSWTNMRKIVTINGKINNLIIIGVPRSNNGILTWFLKIGGIIITIYNMGNGAAILAKEAVNSFMISGGWKPNDIDVIPRKMEHNGKLINDFNWRIEKDG